MSQFIIDPLDDVVEFKNHWDKFEKFKEWKFITNKYVRSLNCNDFMYCDDFYIKTPIKATVSGYLATVGCIVTMDDGRKLPIHPDYLKSLRCFRHYFNKINYIKGSSNEEYPI